MRMKIEANLRFSLNFNKFFMLRFDLFAKSKVDL